VIQHFPVDAPWYIVHALANARVEVDLRRLHEGDALPESLEDHDALVVLGGPDSAAQQSAGYPSLEHELRLLVEAHEQTKPALGVCLGAQVMARAADAKVYAGAAGKEIGWGQVRLTPEASATGLLSGLGEELTALQRHGDTFDLPPQAQLLASSDVYPVQAFQWGSCLALQFHLAVDSLAAVRAFTEGFPDEANLVDGGPAEILRVSENFLRQSDASRSRIYDGWAHSITAQHEITLES